MTEHWIRCSDLCAFVGRLLVIRVGYSGCGKHTFNYTGILYWTSYNVSELMNE